GIVGKALCFVMFILPNNTKQRALIFILLSKSGFRDMPIFWQNTVSRKITFKETKKKVNKMRLA
ncbi:hypothetical protein, partial [Methanosarcina mazei]